MKLTLHNSTASEIKFEMKLKNDCSSMLQINFIQLICVVKTDSVKYKNNAFKSMQHSKSIDSSSNKEFQTDKIN